jgi:hypothetical protein
MGRQFPQQDRPGIVELRDGGRVEIRHIVLPRAGMGRGPDALGAIDVLQAEGDAVHRAAIRAGHDFGFRRAGARHCLVRGNK